MSRWTRAPVTESTRKGMSSVTTWMTVRALDHPSVSVVGLKTRTAAWPGGRDCGELEVRLHRTGEGLRRSGAELLVGHVPEVAADDDRPVGPGVEGGERRDDGVERGRSGLDR